MDEQKSKESENEIRVSRRKSKNKAALFALFLGAFGVHYFYLGIWGSGFICLFLSVAGCWFGSTIAVIGLGVFDYFLLLQMTGSEFDGRFNYRTPTPVEFIFKAKRHDPPKV